MALDYHARPYRRTYDRAIWSFLNNGFLGRDLDADDIAFIETIREHGCIACGSLAEPTPTHCTYSDDVIHRVALLEEMDFWESPYALDGDIVRRSGPLRRPLARPYGATPYAEKRKRDILARKEMQAILEAEQKAWEEQRIKRELQRRQADIDWEKAAPKRKRKRKFGDVRHRHYIPQWRVEEEHEEKLRITQAERAAAAANQAAEAKPHVVLAPTPVQTITPVPVRVPAYKKKIIHPGFRFPQNPSCNCCIPYNGHHTPNYWNTGQPDCW